MDDRLRRPAVRVGSRGQSTTLDYTLSLAIATLLVAGLVTAASGLVDDSREQVVRTELEVIGEHLASDLVAADRLAQSGDSTERLTMTRPLPARVAGSEYTIRTESAGSVQWINLSASGPGVTVSVRAETAASIADTGIDGGTVTITYDPAADELEVSS